MGTTANLIRTLAATLVLASCAAPPPAPVSMRDPNADFSRYQTYGWTQPTTADGQDAPLQLLDKNIRAAIANELKRRGYAEVAENPDLRIAYETASADKIESNPVRVGVGVGSWGGSGGGSIGVGSSSVRNFREGTLVIHAIDRAQNAEVWQGRISGRMTQGSIEAAAVQNAVSAAMRDFPNRNPAASPATN